MDYTLKFARPNRFVTVYADSIRRDEYGHQEKTGPQPKIVSPEKRHDSPEAETNGRAIAIVQQLDPTRKGLMVELLQRSTSLQVFQVKERVKVQPNCVYVIPKAIPEKCFDLVIRTEGIRFATDKSIERFSRWLNSLGERARRLKVTGRVEDGIESIADFYDSAIPRFELVYD